MLSHITCCLILHEEGTCSLLIAQNLGYNAGREDLEDHYNLKWLLSQHKSMLSDRQS